MRSNRFATLGGIILLIAIIFFRWVNAAQAQSDINLLAHYVEVNPLNDGISYNIDIYLSVLEADIPVNELQQENLAVQEDGQKVYVRQLRPLTQEPVNIVLVLDTSASMSGPEMTDVRSAAVAFISRLKPNDQLALVTFDVSAKNQVDELTNDHQKIVDIIDNKIIATRETATCLYDAVYSALKMFAPQPAGSRAVILLTNGKDATATGAKCSDHTADEVVDSASEGELRAPLYILGLDVDVESEDGGEDVEILRGFAEKTGGMYQELSGSSKFANTFDALSTFFRAQHILTYTSTSMPGAHNVVVSLAAPDQSVPLASDTRKFSLSPLPPRLEFNLPLDGETVGDVLKIVVTLATQGDVIVERVAFDVNGVREGEDDTKPYEIELDGKKYPAGQMTITTTAYGAGNTELARSSINVVRAETTEAVVPTEGSAPLPTTSAPTIAPSTGNTSLIFMAISLGVLSIAVIGVLIFFLLRQQKQSVIRELENYAGDGNTLPPMQGIPVYRRVEDDRGAVIPESEPEALGAMTIVTSDDPTLIGHRFEITASLITLGRSADNDIIFPNDKPVSRHHAEIYQISGKLYLREVEMADASGTAKPPKYGTFLNGEPMGTDPAQLKTGDEIQLGKRVRLRFESLLRNMEGDALTYDEDGDDRTMTDDVDKTAIQD